MKPQQAPVLDPDPVPADVRAVIELFATQLAKVTFPDVDAASLRREADELCAEAANVARAQAALDLAIAACTRKTTALSDTASRAIAYAKIYSDAHPDRQPLAAAIATLSSGAGLRARLDADSKPPGKRRGRPPRRSAELFDAAQLPPGPPHEPPA